MVDLHPERNGARRPQDRLKLREFIEQLQAGGRYVFTSEDVTAAVRGTRTAQEAALRRLKEKGRLASPHRGFYVIVPVEYRIAGSPPASWFIDDLMRCLQRPYYVALLTAAALHGAAHQQPQVFQVMTDAPMRNATVGRVRLDYHRNRKIAAVPVTQVQTETGTMRVSTPEATAVDLVRYAPAAGNLDNVATVLIELTERIDPKKLSKAVETAAAPDAQRLGFLLERLGFERLAAAVEKPLSSRRCRPVLLQPRKKTLALTHDPRWSVIPNVEVVPDL